MPIGEHGGRKPTKQKRSAFDLDLEEEAIYGLVAVAVTIVLIVTGLSTWAVAWFMAVLVMFAIWRIGHAEFK